MALVFWIMPTPSLILLLLSYSATVHVYGKSSSTALILVPDHEVFMDIDSLPGCMDGEENHLDCLVAKTAFAIPGECIENAKSKNCVIFLGPAFCVDAPTDKDTQNGTAACLDDVYEGPCVCNPTGRACTSGLFSHIDFSEAAPRPPSKKPCPGVFMPNPDMLYGGPCDNDWDPEKDVVIQDLKHFMLGIIKNMWNTALGVGQLFTALLFHERILECVAQRLLPHSAIWEENVNSTCKILQYLAMFDDYKLPLDGEIEKAASLMVDIALLIEPAAKILIGITSLIVRAFKIEAAVVGKSGSILKAVGPAGGTVEIWKWGEDLIPVAMEEEEAVAVRESLKNNGFWGLERCFPRRRKRSPPTSPELLEAFCALRPAGLAEHEAEAALGEASRLQTEAQFVETYDTAAIPADAALRADVQAEYAAGYQLAAEQALPVGGEGILGDSELSALFDFSAEDPLDEIYTFQTHVQPIEELGTAPLNIDEILADLNDEEVRQYLRYESEKDAIMQEFNSNADPRQLHEVLDKAINDGSMTLEQALDMDFELLQGPPDIEIAGVAQEIEVDPVLPAMPFNIPAAPPALFDLSSTVAILPESRRPVIEEITAAYSKYVRNEAQQDELGHLTKYTTLHNNGVSRIDIANDFRGSAPTASKFVDYVLQNQVGPFEGLTFQNKAGWGRLVGTVIPTYRGIAHFIVDSEKANYLELRMIKEIGDDIKPINKARLKYLTGGGGMLMAKAGFASNEALAVPDHALCIIKVKEGKLVGLLSPNKPIDTILIQNNMAGTKKFNIHGRIPVQSGYGSSFAYLLEDVID